MTDGELANLLMRTALSRAPKGSTVNPNLSITIIRDGHWIEATMDLTLLKLVPEKDLQVYLNSHIDSYLECLQLRIDEDLREGVQDEVEGP